MKLIFCPDLSLAFCILYSLSNVFFFPVCLLCLDYFHLKPSFLYLSDENHCFFFVLGSLSIYLFPVFPFAFLSFSLRASSTLCLLDFCLWPLSLVRWCLDWSGFDPWPFPLSGSGLFDLHNNCWISLLLVSALHIFSGVLLSSAYPHPSNTNHECQDLWFTFPHAPFQKTHDVPFGSWSSTPSLMQIRSFGICVPILSEFPIAFHWAPQVSFAGCMMLDGL